MNKKNISNIKPETENFTLFMQSENHIYSGNDFTFMQEGFTEFCGLLMIGLQRISDKDILHVVFLLKYLFQI